MKSSQILKNHSFMLSTFNTKLLCRKMHAWTLKKQGNMKKCKGKLATTSRSRHNGK